MRLSELKINGASLKEDGIFQSLGLLSHQTEKMLVCFYDKDYLQLFVSNKNISCVVTTKEIAEFIPDRYGVIISDNPMKTFYTIHHHLNENTDFYWSNFKTKISDTAHVHQSAFVAETNVVIGDNCIIEPNVTILPKTLIGNNVIVRAGTVIGSEGFEFKKIDGILTAISHSGGVKIDDNVEIQANCAISKSVFGGYTEIGSYTKLDNLVHIAHNVKIGNNCRLAAAAMLAGSITIGNNVWIGPNCTISSEVIIEDDAEVSLGAVVTRNVKKGQKVSGNFAIEHYKLIEFLKTIR